VFYKKILLNSSTGYNFVLLQWLVVDGFQRFNLKLLSRQTRLSSPDSPPLQVTHVRYAQGEKKIY
jgi:hypothetical protein